MKHHLKSEGIASALNVFAINGKRRAVSSPRKREKLAKHFNQINPIALILGIISLNFLSFVPHTNEEQYLLYAGQHFNSDWIAGSLMATEFPGARLFFECLVGWAVAYLGFEKTVFFGRLLNYFLLAMPLAGIFRHLKFSNIQLFLVLQIFILATQIFFGGEWVFRAMEAKTFAYVFVFWALLKFLKKEYYWAFGFMMSATYFHILIGGWFTICCLAVHLIQEQKFSNCLKLGLFYGIPLLPLLYYLASNMLIKPADLPDDVNLNHIYVYFRNKHHIGLFYTYEFFFQKHFLGILASTTMFFGMWRLEQKGWFLEMNSEFKTLKNLIMVMLAIGFLFVGISWMDKAFFDLSGGFLLKAYPFRMQSLALLFSLILSIYFMSNIPKVSPFWKKYAPVLAVIGLGIAFLNCMKNLHKMTHYQNDIAYNEVIDFFKNQTPKHSTIIVLENNNGGVKDHRNSFAIDLMRRTERDNFVHFKFVPSTPEKMYEWYKRLKIVAEIEANPKQIHKIKNEYKIDYVLAQKGLEMDLEQIFQNEQYQIFKVRKNQKTRSENQALSRKD